MQQVLPRFNSVLATLLLALVLAGCSGGGRSMLALEDAKTELRATKITQQMVKRVGKSNDVEMTKHLQVMADQLAAATNAEGENFRVVLLKSNQANAFTPGAGKILVNEGLLQFADNEAQVAAVMAHEMAHVILKHPQRQKQIRLASKAGGHFMDEYTPKRLANNLGRMLRIGGNATMNGMIRQQEMMADSIGIDILAKAGYDPREMVALLHKLRLIAPARDRVTNVVYGNHPLTADREAAAVNKLNRDYADAFGKISSPKFDALVEPYHQSRFKRLAQIQ